MLELIYCPNCGKPYPKEAELCLNCAEPNPYKKDDFFKSAKDLSRAWLVTLLLCFFLGALGTHRFYVGRNGSGVVMLILCFVLFPVALIWQIVDLVRILVSSFSDVNGNIIKP